MASALPNPIPCVTVCVVFMVAEFTPLLSASQLGDMSGTVSRRFPRDLPGHFRAMRLRIERTGVTRPQG